MTLPAIFLGHGSPMNAIDPASRYNRAFLQTAAAIAKPQAILMISAHWIGRDLRIMSGVHNPILYDFHGFPAALYEAQYPAPGAPELAARVGELLAGYPLHADPDRGLDHGSWAVLRHFYPEADVPVVQLGLNVLQPAAWHWALAEKLRPLRDEGVLIMGSGNIVHNLRELDFARVDEPFAYDWAEAFRDRINRAMLEDDRDTLINYLALDDARRLLRRVRLQKINKTATFRGQQAAGGERIHRHGGRLPVGQDALQARGGNILTHADFRQQRDAHALYSEALQQADAVGAIAPADGDFRRRLARKQPPRIHPLKTQTAVRGKFGERLRCALRRQITRRGVKTARYAHQQMGDQPGIGQLPGTHHQVKRLADEIGTAWRHIHFQFNIRKLRGELRQERREEFVSKIDRQRQAQHPARQRVLPVQLRMNEARLLDQRHGALQIAVAGFRQLDFARSAVKKRHAERLLQRADAARQR